MSSRGFVVSAAAVGAAASAVLTFPLALHVRSAVLEDGSLDAFQFLWNLWWVGQSLLGLHANPFHTRYLFYPDGVGLLFHTFSFSLGLASLPLQAAVGLVAAHNLLVMAAPALALLVVALLAREVTGDPWAALAAGLMTAASPIALWFLPVLYLDCVWLMAALLLFWRRLQRHRRAADVALALVALAALVFASPEYAVMGLALLALDSLARFAAPQRLALGDTWPRGTIAFWAAAGVGLGALALAALSAPAAPPPASHVLVGSGYVAGLLVPPWIAPPPAPFWTVLYLGTAPLVLAPAALVWQPRRAAFWVLAALALAAMSLGPWIHLRHPFPDLRLPPGGLPASGVPGPYWLASKLLPLLGFFRAPYRWVAAAEIPLAVAAALGVASLRRRAVEPAARAALTAALLALVIGGAALDGLGLRAPLAGARVPPAYGVLRDDPEPAAVLELPSGLVAGQFAAFSSLYMYYQTAHGKFLLEGTVARLPVGRRTVLEREFDDFAALPYVKYVVVHRDLLPRAYPSGRDQAEHIVAHLATQAMLVRDEGGIAVYRLQTFRPETVR